MNPSYINQKNVGAINLVRNSNMGNCVVKRMHEKSYKYFFAPLHPPLPVSRLQSVPMPSRTSGAERPQNQMAPTWVVAAVQESVGGRQKSVRFPPNSIPDSAAEAPSLFLHPKPPPRSLFLLLPRRTIHSTLKKGERKEGKGSFTVRTGRSETFGPFRLPRSRKERTKVSSFPVRTPPMLTAT